MKMVDGISIASLFHYNYVNRDKYQYSNSNEGNTDFLEKKNINKNLIPIDIKNLKTFLNENNISVRF